MCPCFHLPLAMHRRTGCQCGDHSRNHADAPAVPGETIGDARTLGCEPYEVSQDLAGEAEHRALEERVFGPFSLNLA